MLQGVDAVATIAPGTLRTRRRRAARVGGADVTKRLGRGVLVVGVLLLKAGNAAIQVGLIAGLLVRLLGRRQVAGALLQGIAQSGHVLGQSRLVGRHARTDLSIQFGKISIFTRSYFLSTRMFQLPI